MRITLNQPVNSTDGPFGELGDVVVDPFTNVVTHLIVEPHRRHFQARLVPIGLVEMGEKAITVQLDEQHLRSLRGVAESDYLPITEQIDLGDGWDVGVEHIVASPYASHEFDTGAAGGMLFAGELEYVSISYDRIPRGECEIRHESTVLSSDHEVVGVVAALMVDDGHVDGIVVQTGVFGFRHRVAVPIGAVERVRTDQISLTLDNASFKRLPPLDEPSDEHPSRFAGLEHRAAVAVKRLRSSLRRSGR